MSRAALYIRVSTDEQAVSGYSIPDQRRELRAHAEREGYEIIEEVTDDGWSGAVGVRPGLDRVMELAEGGRIDLVLAKKRNRLFRSRYYRLMYERDLQGLGVSLVALDDTGNRFADAVNDEFADWYREEVTRNTRDGRMSKARQGKLIAAARPTYGFDYTADRSAYVLVPERMAVVRKIMEMIAGGTSVRQVCRGLEADGVPAPVGGKLWSERHIREFVTNDAYRPHSFEELEPLLAAAGSSAGATLDREKEYGVVWYPKTTTRQGDPDRTRGYSRSRRTVAADRSEQVPIPVVCSGIPRQTVDAARRAMRDNPKYRNSGERVFTLAGLIRCADCGNRLATGRKTDGRSEKVYSYYRCSKHQRLGSAECAMNKAYPADELERLVLNSVLEAVKDRDTLIEQANDHFEDQRARLLRTGSADAEGWYRRLDALERQRANLQRAFAADAMSLEDLRARTAELDLEKAHVERAAAEYEERAQKLAELEAARDATVTLIEEGQWTELGITAPEERRRRFREIGLSATADVEGYVRLSWGLGEETVLCTTDPNSRCTPRARVRRIPAFSPAG